MDYELFKSQQSQLPEKITEMIKLEVETRLQGEKETKMVTEAIFKKFVDDMTTFKEFMEKQNRKFAKDLKEISTESSERSNFLSRYIEDLVKKHEESTYTQFQKIKLLCAKLTEQVKEYIQSAEKSMAEMKAEHTETQQYLKGKLEEVLRKHELTEVDTAIKMSLEQAANKVEFDNIYDALNKLAVNLETWKTKHNEMIEVIQKSIEDTKTNGEKVSEELIKKAEEKADRKIQVTLEQIKKANQDVWDYSLKLSDKMFSREGVKNILDIVPPQTLKYPDIKYQLGDLVVDSKGEYSKPNLAVKEEDQLDVMKESSENIDKDNK